MKIIFIKKERQTNPQITSLIRSKGRKKRGLTNTHNDG